MPMLIVVLEQGKITNNLKIYTTISQKINNDNNGGCVVAMTGPPAYLAADCEAAKPSMLRVDEGGNTLSNKNEKPVRILRLSWRIPSMAMSILNNDYNDNNDGDNNNNNNGTTTTVGVELLTG